MKHKLFLFLAALGLLLPQVAFAYDFEVDGICYNRISDSDAEVAYGSKSSGSVIIPATVTYEGVTYNVTSIGGAFTHCSDLTSVTIPSSVTNIGNQAFLGCSGLTSVTIPNSVTSIGEDAFGDCSGLTSINIPNSVVSIGNEAFAFCSGLTSVTIPSSVTSIGGSAFRFCSGLISVTIPSSVTVIREGLFDSCSSLTSINIPNSVVSIGNAAFAFCTGLTEVTIGSGVTSIGQSAFCGCSGLTSVNIPSGVTWIGDQAFLGCSGLTSIAIESGNTKYDSRGNCNAIIETATNILIQGCKNTTIPGSVTIIGGFSFYGCSGLTSIAIPNSVTSIGWNAFYGCTGLTSVNIPNSVTSIESQAFFGCSGLTSVIIPNSLTSIGIQAFLECDALTSVTNMALVPQKITSGIFSNYGTLHVRKGYRDVFAAKDYWKNFTIVEDFDPVISFTDGKEYNSSGAIDYDEINYTRTFKNTNWQALYVPFSMDYEEWCEDYDIARVYNFIDYDDNDDGEFDRTYLVVKKITSGSTRPNYPYLIRAKATGAQTLVLTDKTLEAAQSNSMDCSSADYTYTFTGSYTPVTNMYANGYYALSGGSLQRANSASVVLGAQRWYMSLTARSGGYAATKAQNIKIVVDGEDETEGIKTPSTSPKGESPVAYDLMGRGVKGAVKGISIVNGKKIIK